MIMHNCIECDDFQMIPIAPKCPAYQKYTCPKCKTVQWIKHSRIEPVTYSEEMVEIDSNGFIKIKED